MKNYDSWKDTKEAAIHAEKLGYSSVWLNTHLLPPAGPLDRPFREAWTALSGLAGATNKVKLGTLVACNSFRNPALPAKMAATLASLSEGRVVLGIGAGWFEEEYRQYGFPFPTVADRMGSLREAVVIVKMMLEKGRATFHGKYYNVKDALSVPVPKPRAPVWIGGGGERLVKMAARLGDGWNSYRMKLEQFKARRKLFSDQVKASKRQESELTVSHVTDAIISASSGRLEKLFEAAARERGESREALKRLESSTVHGTPEEAVKTIRLLSEAGVQHLILNFPSMDLLEQLSYCAEEVMPDFQ